jgi:Cysteine-rich CWC
MTMILKRLTDMILPGRRAARLCEACERPFVCGASFKGCWCLSVELDAETRKELRASYDSCLCRECLESFSKRHSKGAACQESTP